MGVELMLNAVNLNFVAFDAQLRDVLHGGQTFALFMIVVAAAEIGLALAIVLLVFRTHGHIDVDELRELADRDAAPDELDRPGRAGERAARRGAAGAVRDGRASRWSPVTAPTSPRRASRSAAPALGLVLAGVLARRPPRGRRAAGARVRHEPWRPARRSSSRRTSTRSAPRCCCSPRTVAFLVQVYSLGYLPDDPRYPSYAALVSLFTGAMATVVTADDLWVLLVGWELMGACSYFLIAHHWELAEARAGAVKAFLITRTADLGLLFAIFVLGERFGSYRISTVMAAITDGALPRDELWLPAVLVAVAVIGKSAQLPVPHLAAGRDARPDPDLRADPRRHHGRGRRVPGRPDVPAVPRPRRPRSPCSRSSPR